MKDHYDVVILGTGLASLCLTRLLELRRPGTSICTVDTQKGPGRKVGESTVEIGAHFLHTSLQLDSVLRKTQLPKNGLRFWFDNEEHSLSLAEASEDGPMTFSYWQGYQVDREILENTLLDANRSGGATHHFGVSDVRLENPHGNVGTHRVSFARDGERQEITSRWVVDATGIRSLWGRASGLIELEDRVPHGACWARFRGFRSPDSFLKEHGAGKAIFGSRLLSTNHLMNEGYWIWWIPLSGGLMSVGVVYDATVLRDPPRNLDELVRFVRSHRMCAELMEDAEPVDFGRLGKFAFRPERYFSTERIAAIGHAAGFVDPFYSSGLDFIALESEYLCDLISRDLGGEGPQPERVEAYNSMLLAFYEHMVGVVRDVYKTFGSYEISVPRYRRDLHLYWSIYVWPYFSGEFLDPDFVRRFLPLAKETLRRGKFFNRLYVDVYRRLKARGELHRSNRGGYAFNQLGFGLIAFVGFEQQMGSPMDIERARRFLQEIDTATFLSILDILFQGKDSPLSRMLFDTLHGPTLEDLMEWEGGRGFADGFWDEVFRRMTEAARENLARRGLELSGLEICRSNFGKVREHLLELCAGDEDSRRAVEAYCNEPPELEGLPGVEPMRDHIQPRGDWTFSHTPWAVEPLNMKTVYELMENWNYR